ncbi:MAG: N-acetylglucosamine-6-phosphate deacetylase, partial [Spirochaetes bacterium]|nr:N-acetylglucosamine-6-phosphate deacetylase [Spirochaetota bacterium]
MPEKLLITNCRLFNSRGDLDKVSILINRGIIEEIGRRGKSSTAGAVLNAEKRIIAPGFIDIHIQGAGGADVLDGTVESLKTISKTCAGFGTTSFIATTVYRSGGDNRHLN